MAMTDNIADMLTQIRNGQKSKLIYVLLPHSKLKCALLEVLKEEGYINDYSIIENENKKKIKINLRYSLNGNPVIHEIHRVSKPSKRVYTQIKELKGYYNNMGIRILSTSKGILSDKLARKLGVGGEIICQVF